MTISSPDNNEKLNCERSFLKPLYHLSDDGPTVLIDETTGELYIEKRLNYFNIKVYEWLKVHPYPLLAQIHDFWLNHDGSLSVIENYVNGKVLEDCKVDLSGAAKRQILIDVCDALLFLHSAKPPIIHRDIKPLNIMVTSGSRGVLLDFDAAKIVNRNESRDTMLIGTDGVAAPEQYGFGASDVRTDVYGVGMLIKVLFPDSKAYQRIAAKATQLSPEDRYQDIASVKKAILRLNPKENEKPPALPRKIAIALPVYFLAAVISFMAEASEGMAHHLLYTHVGWMLVFFAMLEVIFAWFPITRQLPGRTNPILWQRILATIGWTIFFGAIAFSVFIGLSIILFE